MFERQKRALASVILNGSAALLRGNLLGPDARDGLWKLAQRYATYFDVRTHAALTNGMKARVSSDPRVEQEIYLFGEWEPLFTRYIRDIRARDRIFLDLGANIGYFTLVASPIFGEVHAIEASPSTFRRLRENIDENGIENVVLYEMAIGETDGHIDFYQDSRQSGAASTIPTEHSVFEARVPVARLETILSDLDWRRVRLVKIDVEGGEAPLLNSIFGLKERLSDDIEIFVEFDPARPDTWAGIEAFLANGFSAHLLQGPYDRRDYVERNRRTTLDPIHARPSVFCDLLLRRAPR